MTNVRRFSVVNVVLFTLKMIIIAAPRSAVTADGKVWSLVDTGEYSKTKQKKKKCIHTNLIILILKPIDFSAISDVGILTGSKSVLDGTFYT